MAIVRAFKAFRPKVGLASKIAALPYDVMNSEEAREMVRDNEYSLKSLIFWLLDLQQGLLQIF